MNPKAIVLLICSFTAEAAVTKQKALIRGSANYVRVPMQMMRQGSNATILPEGANYGHKDCPCVGLDEIEGETGVTLKGGRKATYPADLGARCEAWDKNHHPDCKSGGDDWCEQQWSYVDPSNCGGVRELPKPSKYIPGAKYHGRPLHFSYQTCDGADSYSGEKDKQSIGHIERMCKNEYVDEAKWGPEECRCVGIGPQPGKTKVTIDGQYHDFPADTGAFCNTWEEGRHPDCTGSSPPEWCSKAWCYVDPCSCRLASPPKTSSYLPDANYQGKAVYFSYEACGAADTYTAGNKEAWVNHKTSKDCGTLKKCAWDGKHCLGKELVEVCSSAFGIRALVALLLPVFGLLY